MNCPKKYLKQVTALEVYLTELFGVQEPNSVTVYASADRGDGFRIIEISIASATSGCSFQRCILSLATQALFIAAEDFVRMFNVQPYRPQGWESDIDDFAEAKEKLEWVVKAMNKQDEEEPGQNLRNFLFGPKRVGNRSNVNWSQLIPRTWK